MSVDVFMGTVGVYVEDDDGGALLLIACQAAEKRALSGQGQVRGAPSPPCAQVFLCECLSISSISTYLVANNKHADIQNAGIWNRASRTLLCWAPVPNGRGL